MMTRCHPILFISLIFLLQLFFIDNRHGNNKSSLSLFILSLNVMKWLWLPGYKEPEEEKYIIASIVLGCI